VDPQRIVSVSAFFIAAFLLFSPYARGAVVSAELEVHLVHNVSTNWQTVPLENTYTDAIPVCSYNLIFGYKAGKTAQPLPVMSTA